MTTARPPFARRWEYQLGVGLLALLVPVLQSRRVGQGAEREAERALHPWLGQLDRERSVGRAALALWLAWRSYRLERAARAVGPS